MAIEERWFVLCSWIENRWKTLTKAFHAWKRFENELQLQTRWLDTAEKTFRQMEQSPTEETKELMQQEKQISVSRGRGRRIPFLVSCSLFSFLLIPLFKAIFDD